MLNIRRSARKIDGRRGAHSHRAGLFLTLIALAAILIAASWQPAIVLAESATAEPTANPANQQQTLLLDPEAAASFEINGKAFVLYDAQSDTFLLGHNPDKPLAPASITKVMTILLALEKLELSDTITVTRDMFSTIPNDYVRLGLVDGETISVEEALYASLLISANDTAMALALKMGGSMSGFSALMNARASELGCTGTHFSNPYGLAEESNLTTAHDMALILAAALKHGDYTRIAKTKTHLIPATDKVGTRGLTNGNRFVSTEKYHYEPYIGGKTGFTDLSGHTIAAGASRDGRTLIGVILGATSAEIRYANLITLFDYGFSAYRNIRLDPAAFEPVKAQAVGRLEARVSESGLDYTLARVDMQLNAYTTATLDQAAKGFTCCAGDDLLELAAGWTSQVIDLPLYVDYPDGMRSQVGTLSLTLEKAAAATTASSSGHPDGNGSAQKPRLPLGTLILRIVLALLAVCLLAAIVLWVLIRRELKRRRQRRRRPDIRRV